MIFGCFALISRPSLFSLTFINNTQKRPSPPPLSLSFSHSFNQSKARVQHRLQSTGDSDSTNDSGGQLSGVPGVDPFTARPPVPRLLAATTTTSLQFRLPFLARLQVVDPFARRAAIRRKAAFRGRADGALEAVERGEGGALDRRDVDPSAVAVVFGNERDRD